MADTPSTKFQRNDAGLLIAVEGIDGTGKSTQCAMLAEWFEAGGREARVLPEPTRGPYGMELRRRAREGRLDPRAEFELFLEDRAWNVETNIMPVLDRGGVVILDRYYISSMAYQGARGLDPMEIQVANERIAPRPDIVFLLMLSVDEALDRIHGRDEHGPNLYEDRAYQENVAAIFDSLNWIEIERIDAAQPVDEMQKEMRVAVWKRKTSVT